MWKDTIKEMFSFGNYTVLQYEKGGDTEWCVANRYNRETKSWAAGNYCYSLEGVMATVLELMDSRYVKGNHQLTVEMKHGITFERMEEIASRAIDNLDGEEKDYFLEDTELSDEEKEFFGIEDDEDEEDW